MSDQTERLAAHMTMGARAAADYRGERRLIRRRGLEYWGEEERRPAVHYRFDELCIRFGEARIGRVIRERILTTRARRILASSRESVRAAPGQPPA